MTRRSMLILLELMAAILFFALAGSVCLAVLVEAEGISAQAASLTTAAQTAGSAAELIRSADSGEAARAALEGAYGRELSDGRLTVEESREGSLTIYNIEYTAGAETFRLTLRRCFGEVD